jgi:hypothetical protein
VPRLERHEIADAERGEPNGGVAKPAVHVAAGVLLDDLHPHSLDMAFALAVGMRAVAELQPHELAVLQRVTSLARRNEVRTRVRRAALLRIRKPPVRRIRECAGRAVR